MGLNKIKIMPPLDGIINNIIDRLEEVEKSVRDYNSQQSEIKKDVAKLDEKIRRIEKYAK